MKHSKEPIMRAVILTVTFRENPMHLIAVSITLIVMNGFNRYVPKLTHSLSSRGGETNPAQIGTGYF